MGRKPKTLEELNMILRNKFPDVELISSYESSRKNVLFRCRVCGHEWSQRFFNLSGCPQCKPNRRTETFSHEDYLKMLNDRGINNIIPIEQYIMSRTNIKHKCLKCGYEWSVKPNNILTGYGCPFCSGKAVIKGVNDLWTTDRSTANLLLNKEDGYKYSRMSGKKLDWVCGECGSVVRQRTISNVVQQGLRCPVCSDGNSIPNKFIYNILDFLNIVFETEKTFQWSQSRRYDVFIPSVNCIIEMHGMQHYDNNGFESCGGKTLTEEQSNDIFKHDLAMSNNINYYIVIDGRYSTFEWLYENIKKSELNTFLNMDDVDWEYCYQKSLNSAMIAACDLWNKNYSTAEIASRLHLSTVTICSYLRRGNCVGLCTYSGINEKLKRVLCVNTGEAFNSIKEAKNKYGSCHITDCCKGKRKSAGIHPVTGEKLIWRYIKNKAS